MSYADERFIQNCRDILTNGVWDTELEVRPHWDDGAPAHTVKKFGIINRYDLREEFPILTLRRTYFKTCISGFFSPNFSRSALQISSRDLPYQSGRRQIF